MACEPVSKQEATFTKRSSSRFHQGTLGHNIVGGPRNGQTDKRTMPLIELQKTLKTLIFPIHSFVHF